MKKRGWITGLCLALSASLHATPVKQLSELTQTELEAQIKAADEGIFANEFGDCNRKKYAEMLADDVAYLDDRWGYSPQFKQFAIMTCGSGKEERRELIDDSFEVYRLKYFGAIQLGKHHFYKQNDAGEWVLFEKAQYIHT